MSKCKICKKDYDKKREGQVVCSYPCSIEYAKKLDKKREAKKKSDHRRALKQFNDSDINIQKRLAQNVFNTYIRERDKDLPCISCGTTKPIQYHAGHYKPAGGFAYLRFNEDNCHRQCSVCNNHLSGNLVAYRANLMHKIGLAKVEELEKPNKVKKFTIEEYQEVIEIYRKKLKDLRKL